jgi:hypothetical protein
VFSLTASLKEAATAGVALADGYGIEIRLLIDIYQRHGLDAIVEVDLGERMHRNRRLHSLGRHADDVLDAVLARVGLKRSCSDPLSQSSDPLLTGMAGAEVRRPVTGRDRAVPHPDAPMPTRHRRSPPARGPSEGAPTENRRQGAEHIGDASLGSSHIDGQGQGLGGDGCSSVTRVTSPDSLDAH